MKDNHILFIHIPKTAGTSFRIASKKYFGENNTFFDYSPSSVETSDIIIKYVYKTKDFETLNKIFKEHKTLFLSGHFHVGRYIDLFDSNNIITFMRNPVEQVISHYQHYVKHNQYRRDIVDFIKNERFKNIQTKMLAGKSLEEYGFVGLTEYYNQSIELINYKYGLQIEAIVENVNQEKNLTNKILTDDIVKLIKQENKEDINLYQHAKIIFEQKMYSHYNIDFNHKSNSNLYQKFRKTLSKII